MPPRFLYLNLPKYVTKSARTYFRGGILHLASSHSQFPRYGGVEMASASTV